MLTQPKLVKNESPQKKTINLKTQTKGSAQFLLGLNNRVSHMDKRIHRLESATDHILRHHIGYKELTLTFVLALLMFTSINLGLKEFNGTSPNQQNIAQQQAQLIPLLQQNAQLQSSIITNNKQPKDGMNIHHQFIWPLEKQSNISEVEYAQHKHGIELTSKLGDPIVAIENGEVIYSGNAINSYGNLILIQHENHIISVYGNNYSNYVHEGDKVKKGQLIAAVGESDGKRPKLYFEVRFKGKAQDPFLYFK
ncbi:murein hydrolase activator EnvC family protein [Bermanella sp. WJH001]|uniref:murein hydrolase activator EnvC family protein n=1 Tax=Bermanella sp. WJH001 TaxID=3048005 RepID=UPI0024BDA351|nr:M23 family metallopeptidase [Bermanella sp. WJH001]MDJ1537182.1 M23 family metallopeptidase [Bermanella sp. WJH001]